MFFTKLSNFLNSGEKVKEEKVKRRFNNERTQRRRKRETERNTKKVKRRFQK